MDKLELEFHKKMTEIYFKAKDEIGNTAIRFKQLCCNHQRYIQLFMDIKQNTTN